MPRLPQIAIVLLIGVICVAPGSAASAAMRFDALALAHWVGETPTEHNPMPRYVLGDLDGDGVPDLVTTGWSDSLFVFLGAGDGRFTQRQAVGTGQGSQPVLADFDLDGAVDIAWGGFNGGGVLYGDGSGRNWTRVTHFTDPTAGILPGDFDADGRPDLAVVSSSREIVTLLARPARQFTRVVCLRDSVPIYPWDLQSADLDGNGFADLVLSRDELVVLLGRGDGTFARSTVSIGPYPRALGFDLADVTGDGVLDLMVSQKYSITFCAGRGDGSFEPPQDVVPSLTVVHDVAIEDVDRNGTWDLIYADRREWLTTHPVGPDGAVGASTQHWIGSDLTQIETADLNQDERPDLVAMSVGVGYLAVMIAEPEGPYRGATSWVTAVPAGDPVAGDFDGDGVPDLVSPHASTGIRVHSSRPGRTFHAHPAVTLPGAPTQLRCGDVDGDGHLDVVALLPGPSLAVLRGNGDGTLQTPMMHALGVHASAVFVLADVDGDQVLDAMVALPGALRTLRGQGDGTFLPLTERGLEGTPEAIEAGDLDGNSPTDLAILTRSTGWTAKWTRALGLGDGTFTLEPYRSLGAVYVRGLQIADVDGDSHSDVITSLGQVLGGCNGPLCGSIDAYLQTATGGITGPVRTPWPTIVGLSLQVGDLDRDGDLDALIGGPVVYALLGDRTGRFALSGAWAGIAGGDRPGTIADFDADGWMDLAQGGPEGLHVLYGCESDPPSLDLVSPTPDQELAIGANQSITWTATDSIGVAGIDVLLSREGHDGPFEVVASNLPHTGSWEWTVAGPPSDHAVLKLVARDPAGNVGIDRTAGTLRIRSNLSADTPSASRDIRLEVAPNPAVRTVTVRVAVPADGHTRVDLVDLQGRRMATLHDGPLSPGVHELRWVRPRGFAGASGVYFVRVESSAGVRVRRLVLVDGD